MSGGDHTNKTDGATHTHTHTVSIDKSLARGTRDVNWSGSEIYTSLFDVYCLRVCARERPCSMWHIIPFCPNPFATTHFFPRPSFTHGIVVVRTNGCNHFACLQIRIAPHHPHKCRPNELNVLAIYLHILFSIIWLEPIPVKREEWHAKWDTEKNAKRRTATSKLLTRDINHTGAHCVAPEKCDSPSKNNHHRIK